MLFLSQRYIFSTSDIEEKKKKKNRGCLISHVAIKNTRFQSCHSEIRFPDCLKKTQLIMTAMTENFTVNYLLSFEHIIAISTRFFSL